MAVALPTPVNMMQTDWDTDARARGAFAGTLEAQPATRNTKGNGWLPISGAATAFVNSQATSATGPLRGVYWEFLASGSYDVSTDTRVLVFTYQHNAPNRIQLATRANDGMVMRLGTDGNTPPTNYRTWQIAGNDTGAGKARENPKMVVIDLNDTTHDATVGTFDNTAVETFGMGCVRFNISGNSTVQWFLQRAWVFTTTKGSADIPVFTGAGSEWADLTDLVDGTSYANKISDEWAKREGDVFAFSCPISIGDGTTATTFDDGGAVVFWSDTDVDADPRVRVTSQAFRVYADLRDNAADTITLTGKYNVGNSNPDWDFDLDLACTITIDTASFRNIGVFTMGSSVSGAATFQDCDVVTLNHVDADLDGSNFSAPSGTHLLQLNF